MQKCRIQLKVMDGHRVNEPGPARFQKRNGASCLNSGNKQLFPFRCEFLRNSG